MRDSEIKSRNKVLRRDCFVTRNDGIGTRLIANETKNEEQGTSQTKLRTKNKAHRKRNEELRTRLTANETKNEEQGTS